MKKSETKKLTMKSLTEDIATLEAGKKQVSIAQIKEIMGIVALLVAGGRGDEVVAVFKATGKRKINAELKKVKLAEAEAKAEATKKPVKKAIKKPVTKTAKKVVKKVAKKPTTMTAKKIAKKIAKK